MRAEYHDLVVTACEWRAIGLADPHDMAAEVFLRLDERKRHDLRSLYRAINQVVLAVYQRHSDSVSVLDRLRTGVAIDRPTHTLADDALRALSNLRGRDHDLLQYRFWDELTDEETAEVTGWPVDKVRSLLAAAGTRYLAKLSGKHPDLNLTEVPQVLRDLKPGIYGRHGMRG